MHSSYSFSAEQGGSSSEEGIWRFREPNRPGLFHLRVKYPGPSHRNPSEWRDSNPRRPHPKCGTLPLSYIPITNIMPGDPAFLAHEPQVSERVPFPTAVVLELVGLAHGAPFPTAVRRMGHRRHILFSDPPPWSRLLVAIGGSGPFTSPRRLLKTLP